MLRKIYFLAFYLAALFSNTVFCEASMAQLSESTAAIVELSHRYRLQPNIPYLTADNHELKLDIYQQLTPGPHPTLIFIHGGGWRRGNKELALFAFLPYLDMGFSVVNVEYRLTNMSQAPAAVEDCLCALRWVIRNAQDYNLDPDKIVVTGASAGGHLALTTGMITASAGLDLRCPGREELKVAAIINWFGVTDVRDMLDGPNLRDAAVAWIGSRSDRFEMADRLSPINYVRSNLPPILTIHGDEDPLVPYEQAVRFHQALDRASAPNQLLTIYGGRHVKFSLDENLEIYETIQEFLREYNLLNTDN